MTHLNDLSKVYREQIASQETQEEGYKPIDREKENKMYRRAGNLARTSLSSKGKKKEDAQNKSSKIVSAIARQKENERFAKMGDERARSNYKEEVDPEKSKKIRKKLPHMGKGNPHYDAKSAGISRVKDFKFTPVKEGYAPGDVDQKVGAVTAIPKKEQEAARKRLLAKAAAKRKSKESKCEEVEHINEEEYDRMRDRKLERYGSGYRSAGNRRYTARSGGTQPKPMPKKKDGPSALDIVKGEIEKKYGKGAIMDTSKKKK